MSGRVKRDVLPQTLVGRSSKSSFDLTGARRWGQRVAGAAEAGEVDDEGLYVCPAFPLIPVLGAELVATGVALGAQDVSASPPGAFTGEVSAELLAELGVRYVMVGHPERVRRSPQGVGGGARQDRAGRRRGPRADPHRR